MHLCLDQWAGSQANVFAQLYSFINYGFIINNISGLPTCHQKPPAMALACSTYLKRITL